MHDVRTRAIEAWEEALEEARRRERERWGQMVQESKRFILERLEYLGIDGEDGEWEFVDESSNDPLTSLGDPNPVFRIDPDLAFIARRLDSGSPTDLLAIKPCPDQGRRSGPCQNALVSWPITELADLGRFLAGEGHRHHTHYYGEEL